MMDLLTLTNLTSTLTIHILHLGPWATLGSLCFFMAALCGGDILALRGALMLAYIFTLVNGLTGVPTWPFVDWKGRMNVDMIFWAVASGCLHACAVLRMLCDELPVRFKDPDDAQLARFLNRRSGMEPLEAKEVLKRGRWLRMKAGERVVSSTELHEHAYLLVQGRCSFFNACCATPSSACTSHHHHPNSFHQQQQQQHHHHHLPNQQPRKSTGAAAYFQPAWQQQQRQQQQQQNQLSRFTPPSLLPSHQTAHEVTLMEQPSNMSPGFLDQQQAVAAAVAADGGLALPPIKVQAAGHVQRGQASFTLQAAAAAAAAGAAAGVPGLAFGDSGDHWSWHMQQQPGPAAVGLPSSKTSAANTTDWPGPAPSGSSHLLRSGHIFSLSALNVFGVYIGFDDEHGSQLEVWSDTDCLLYW